jgi:uncharacterized membrane protein
MTMANKIENPSTDPSIKPFSIIPIIRVTMAAAIRIWRIVSSKFSRSNSHRVFVEGILLMFVPNLCQNKSIKMLTLVVERGYPKVSL